MVIVSKKKILKHQLLTFFLLTLNLAAFSSYMDNMNDKTFEISNIENLDSFFTSYNHHFVGIKYDSRLAISMPYKVNAYVNDTSTLFLFCGIPIQKIYIDTSNSIKKAYLIIDNSEKNIEKIKLSHANLPYMVTRMGQEGVEDFDSSFCFEKKNYDVWVSLATSIFTGKSFRDVIIITLENRPSVDQRWYRLILKFTNFEKYNIYPKNPSKAGFLFCITYLQKQFFCRICLAWELVTTGCFFHKVTTLSFI